MEVPTALIGQTQSGKTFRGFRLFEEHDGPAIFADVQWRSGHMAPTVRTVETISQVCDTLAGWDGKDPAPKVVWRPDSYEGLDQLVDYLWSVHRTMHVRNYELPRLAIFLDEISLAADNSALADNAAVRLFTQCYQHDIIPVALTQRPAQTSRNVLGNAWEWYVFSADPADLETLRSRYRREVPDPAWIANPEDHHYFVYRIGRWAKGNQDGVELEVAQVPEVQSPPEDALPEPDAPGQADVPSVGQDGVPEVRPDVSKGPSGP